MNSIKIDTYNGNWKKFEWFLLSSSHSLNSIFYCPNLKISLLVTSRLAESLKMGILPSFINKRLESKINNPIYPIYERPKAFHLAIGLTNNCTLGCLYCHAEADKNTNISKNIINSAIEYSFKEAGKTPNKVLTVSFAVGGEPTMNWDLFTYTIKQIKEFENKKYYDVKKVFLSMTTNCYYGESKREYISNNFDTITISLDGFKAIQDLHRPHRSGKGSYFKVEETCKYFIENDRLKVGIRATVSGISVKSLPEIISHFYLKFGNNFSVTFEPLVQIGRASNGILEPPNEKDFALFFWESKRVGDKLGIKVTSSGVNINRLIGRYCGAMSIPSFTVCTNGIITACHRDQDGKDYGYGLIDETTGHIVIDENKVKSNIAKTEIPESCQKCFAKIHCAGDCPDLRRINFSRCDFNKYIIYKQIEELLLAKSNI